MNILGNGLHRIRYELIGYFRGVDQVVFTFLFPILMLLLLGSIFSADTIQLSDGTEISGATLLIPGFVAMAPWLSGIQGLGIEIAVERNEGGLKRLGATPLSPASYFIGKLGQVFVTTALQTAILLLVAKYVLGAELPSTPERWWTFTWVMLLSLTVCTAVGIAVSALPRSGRSASAVIIPIVLIPQFISGVYLSWNLLPEWLQNIAGALPLKWMAQGMRAAWLPDEMAAVEQGGEWNLGLVAIALAVWLVIGVVLSLLTFRWTRARA